MHKRLTNLLSRHFFFWLHNSLGCSVLNHVDLSCRWREPLSGGANTVQLNILKNQKVALPEIDTKYVAAFKVHLAAKLSN